MDARGQPKDPAGFSIRGGITMKDTKKKDQGFTLVEILIAIVVVGILAAVVVVGISSLTNKGNSSACASSRDAAIAGATVHYANTGAWPLLITDMTGATAELTLPTGVTVDATGLVAGPVSGWKLTMTPKPAGTAPTWLCS
jgi:prepilin-type N-terminal cleavage/methylation domain-containing protein